MTSPDRASLRLRLYAGVLGATLLAGAVLGVGVLVEVRDALYARRIADAREQLRGLTSTGGRGATLSDAACPAAPVRSGNAVVVCETLPAGGSALLAVDLPALGDQLRAVGARLVAAMASALLLFAALLAWVLERGVVRRLAAIDAGLDRLGEDHAEELLPGGGDSVGRLGGAVNRLGQRLREERARTRDQIVQLREANWRLAEEQRALSDAREDLARSERLASVGRLASGVAHELGNPVAALLGYAGILRSQAAGDRKLAEYADRIAREAGRMDRILRDLLDLARPGPLRLGAVDAARAIERAASHVGPVSPGLRIAREVPKDFQPVLADEHYLVQLLVNLISNSAKAGARTVDIRGRLEAEQVVLELADDGRGIPPEHRPRLFEPFFTTAAPGEGTGLGLALCHATMQRFGGSIEAAEPVGGHGARFVLRFRPAAAAARGATRA